MVHKDRIRKALQQLDPRRLESELRNSDANRTTAELLVTEVPILFHHFNWKNLSLIAGLDLIKRF
jgi:hypothetical protein